MSSRLFIAAFADSVGGARAADNWVKTIDAVVRMRRSTPPTPVFDRPQNGRKGMLSDSSVAAWKRQAELALLQAGPCVCSCQHPNSYEHPRHPPQARGEEHSYEFPVEHSPRFPADHQTGHRPHVQIRISTGSIV
jgi:hypothetical protein